MVSLSTNEMLHQMVENYGYGAYLFSFLSMDQLEKLQQIDPDLDQYIDDLMTDKLYDPEAKQILIQKYKNDRWTHPPEFYQMEFTENFSDKDMNLLSKKILDWINQNLTSKQFRKGDVLYISNQEIEGYYIFNEKFINVYLRYKDEWEIIETVPESFDILGNTPANFWNEIDIPGLSFRFPLNQIFDNIKWSKKYIDSQNYLLGEFKFRKRKSKIYIPLSSSSTQDAKKLAIGLQLRNLVTFYPNDPQNIIASEPSTLFGMVGESNFVVKEEEEIMDEIEEQY